MSEMVVTTSGSQPDWESLEEESDGEDWESSAYIDDPENHDIGEGYNRGG